MTDPITQGNPDTTADDDAVDVHLDTTSGERDPLSTDDGLAEVAEQMPAVAEDRAVDDNTGSQPDGEPVDLPDLQVGPDGADPVADLAQPGSEVA